MSKLSSKQELLIPNLRARQPEQETARNIYQKILQSAPQKNRAKQCLVTLGQLTASPVKNPPEDMVNDLINLYNEGSLINALELAKQLLVAQEF